MPGWAGEQAIHPALLHQQKYVDFPNLLSGTKAPALSLHGASVVSRRRK